MPPADHLLTRETTTALAGAFASALDHVALVDANGIIGWVNKPWAAFVGQPSGALIGVDVATFVAPVSHDSGLAELLGQVITGRRAVIFEGIGRGAGGPRHIEYAMTPIADPDGATGRILIIGRDVTARRQQLAALRESEQFFRRIFEHGPIGVMIASADWRILRVNSRFAEIVGYEEAELGACRIDDLTHPDDCDRDGELLDQLQDGELEAYQVEIRMVRKDRRAVWTQVTRTAVTDADNQVLYVVTLAEDVDARKQAEVEREEMEERLRDRQKLESLGLLAGGIAHDLNNLLVPILGNAELTLNELPAYAPQRVALQEIVLASRRAAQLAQQMQAYSGRGHFVMGAVDLSAIAGDMTTVLRASLGADISLAFDLLSSLPAIHADASQMQQIVLNLVQNASEAMSDRGGTVTVSTGTRELTHELLESFYLPTDLPEGDYVFIRVADAGRGMSPDVLERLFEPFFSTKGPGRGLGLPAVLGIVRGHGGAIAVDSVQSGGTTVTVYFPTRSQRAGHESHVVSETRRADRHAPHGTVLVVEDDEAVRALAARTLERAGYQTVTANDGHVAIEYLREHGSAVACVVLDLVMPHVHGEAVCRELTELAPAIPVVVISGYLDQVTEQVAVKATGVLQKPFTPQTLRDAVRAAIDDRN
jgi:PAS domain S-box-containing protein